MLDASLSVKDLQEFHGLIDEFGKAYRDDAAKSESFLIFLPIKMKRLLMLF